MHGIVGLFPSTITVLTPQKSATYQLMTYLHATTKDCRIHKGHSLQNMNLHNFHVYLQVCKECVMTSQTFIFNFAFCFAFLHRIFKSHVSIIPLTVWCTRSDAKKTKYKQIVNQKGFFHLTPFRY